MALKRHSRSIITERASIEISLEVNRLVTKHDLTFGELFSILASIMGQWSKYAIREERGTS